MNLSMDDDCFTVYSTSIGQVLRLPDLCPLQNEFAVDRLERGAGISPALADAQHRLESLRLTHRLKHNQDQPSNALSHGRFSHPPSHQSQTRQQQPLSLPNHLGWDSVPFTHAYRLAQKRQLLEQTKGQTNGDAKRTLVDKADRASPPPQRETLPVPNQAIGFEALNVEALKLSPDIALAILRNKLAAPGRIWLLLRFLDKEGRGWVTGEEARQHLCQEESPLHVCGRRQLRNLLAGGENTFWQQTGDRIWLTSTAKVAAKLGLSHLNNRPVQLPLSILLKSIGTVRAHFYASFHSSRTRHAPHSKEVQASPISRNTLTKLSSAGRRTQMLYEKRVGVRRESNFAVGNTHTIEEEQNTAWQHGRATFQFHDRKGKLGESEKPYIAWQLPNSFYGPHDIKAGGSQKRINRQLADLFNEGITGNGDEAIDPVCGSSRTKHLFYHSGARAAKVYNRSPHQDIYWRSRQSRSGRYRLWHIIPALEKENKR